MITNTNQQFIKKYFRTSSNWPCRQLLKSFRCAFISRPSFRIRKQLPECYVNAAYSNYVFSQLGGISRNSLTLRHTSAAFPQFNFAMTTLTSVLCTSFHQLFCSSHQLHISQGKLSTTRIYPVQVLKVLCCVRIVQFCVRQESTV